VFILYNVPLWSCGAAGGRSLVLFIILWYSQGKEDYGHGRESEYNG